MLDTINRFHYEELFYQTCDDGRLRKPLVHYELFKQAIQVPGDILEAGVFRGCSFIRFAMYRKMLDKQKEKALLGFDTFGEFPDCDSQVDAEVSEFVTKTGGQSISVGELTDILRHKNCLENVRLVEGDLCETIHHVCKPGMKLCLVNLDVDLYKPSCVALTHVWPLLSPGGILILDNYGVYQGETQAVREYFSGKPGISIRRLPFADTPNFIVKE